MNKTPVPQLLALSTCKYFINSSRYFIFSNSRVSSIYFLKNNPYFVAHKLTNGLRNFPQYSIFIRQLTLCLELSLGPVSACQLQVVFLIGSSIYSFQPLPQLLLNDCVLSFPCSRKYGLFIVWQSSLQRQRKATFKETCHFLILLFNSWINLWPDLIFYSYIL